VAYIRFASVYRSFEDVEAFADVIEELQPRPPDEHAVEPQDGDR
ncbi:MAG: transcriptional regulator NrdR, partial [Betaproteobacteria bacterium]|nr:transcriptional regulator NrdR [Betaproteobacteria bacterium]